MSLRPWRVVRTAVLSGGLTLAACGGDEPGTATATATATTPDTEVTDTRVDDTEGTTTDTEVATQPETTAATEVAEVDAAPETVAPETVATASGLVLNEIVCTPTTGDDWVELYVAGTSPVHLADYTLVDDDPAHVPAALPDVTLAPGDHYVVEAASQAPADASAWVPFKLGAGDQVTLATLAGEQVDILTWRDGDAPAGASYGRLPDGTANVGMLEPTPGAANHALTTPLASDPFPTDRVIPVVVDMAAADWQALIANARNESPYPATVHYGDVSASDVTIRPKGNSSLNAVAGTTSHRFSFKIDLNDVVPDQRLLGLKKLVLNNGFKDPTLIREALAYGLMREFGVPAPRTAFVDLTVAGEHLGVYTAVEAVDSEFIARWFDDHDGDLLKPEQPDGNLLWEDANATSYSAVELQTNADTSDLATFVHLLDVLAHGAASDYPSVLDTEEILRATAINALLVNLDSYLGSGHNYYLYEQAGVFAMIPWDTNEAFGNFNCGCGSAGILAFAIDAPTCSPVAQKPLVAKLLADPALRARYHALLGELVAGLFAPAAMQARINAAADLIRPYVAADTTKFFSTEAFETGLTADLTSTGPGSNGTTFGLASFVAQRGAAVTSQLAATTSAATTGCGAGGNPGNPGDPGNPANPAKCPDGVCDDAEQSNPALCPADCP